MRNFNPDILAIQQAANEALKMSDMYQLVLNGIMMNDEYTIIKNVSMGGLSPQYNNQSIQPIPLPTQQNITGFLNGVGNFINTLNDTAKSVLQLFQ